MVLAAVSLAWGQARDGAPVIPQGTRTADEDRPALEAPAAAAVEEALPATRPVVGAAARSRAVGPAAVIGIEGEVNDFMASAIRRRIESARQAGAKTIILSINTPGGLVTSAQEISRYLKRQDDLHIVAYVQGQALSAGAMISAACNEIVMEPYSQIGASAVILAGPGGMQEIGETERAKFTSPVMEEFYDSAVRNGHSFELLAAMVSVDRTAYFIENAAGERRIVDKPTYETLTADGEWKPVEGVRNPIDSEQTLLTLSADLAAKLGLSSGTYATPHAFAESRALPIVAELLPTGGDRLLAWLNSMGVRAGLMTIFMLALYMSFSTPGHGLPEVVAMSALGLMLGVPLMSGHAQWYEIVAVALGLMLLAVELFVLPGFGITGVTGILLILFGLTMTFAPPIRLPGAPIGLGMDWSALLRGLVAVLGGLIASLLLWWWLSRYLTRVPYFNRLILQTSAGDVATVGMPEPAVVAPWPQVGAVGKVVTDLRPGGTAAFLDETTSDTRTTDVVCDCGFVPRGTEVVVREVHGNVIVVRPVQASTNA